LGTNEKTLIDIICSRSNDELVEIKRVYEDEFKRLLECDVKSDTSGDFRRLLLALLETKRDPHNHTDEQKAHEAAKQLYAAGEKKWGTDEATFNTILATECVPQLRAIFDQYSVVAGHGIEKAIQSEFSGDAKRAYLTLIECIQNRPRYFANRINDAMKGMGTRDRELITIIVQRAEYDLALIRDEYRREFNKKLVDAIRSECSGAYQDSLIAITRVAMSYQQFNGTIRPQPNFNPVQTAEILKEAMKGFGCDKHKVLHELTRINSAQRQMVSAEYMAMYGSDLRHDLKEELHGDFEEVILALMLSPAVYDARHLHKAISEKKERRMGGRILPIYTFVFSVYHPYWCFQGLGTKEDVLIDVICTRSNEQLNAIKVAYEGEFGRSLERAIKWDTSGDFERLLIALLQARRDESNRVNEQKAFEEAQKLYEAGEKKWGTDESTFTSILVTENFHQLRKVFEQYNALAGHPIEQAIKSEFSGDTKNGFITVIECIQSTPKFFAHRIHHTMKGFGTNDSELIRLIVSRSECDLALIRDAYPTEFEKTLVDAIRSECSGAYRDCLIAIARVAMYYHQFNGTIRQQPNFNPVQTAEILKEAMKGLGCDKHKVLHELTRINSAQRQMVSAEYMAMYGSDLRHDLKEELHGDFEEVILALMLSPAVYDARHLHKAISGLGTKENVLIDVICTRSNEQLNAIKVAYEGEFGRSLESAVKWDTSGDFERLLVALLQARRDESNRINDHKAKEDAQKLFEAGENTWGTDESTFTSILVTENFHQLRRVFEHYNDIAGHPIEQAIEREFGGDTEKGFIVLVDCIQSTPKFFAQRIHHAMKGFGTNDSELIRLIVSRSECDLALIRDAYANEFETTLVDAIRSECSGAYKDCLIAIVEGN
uniref:Annexin n=2 Tax=Toxocara canis TaxID=6265 RepID=A0A183UWH1_TOXCA